MQLTSEQEELERSNGDLLATIANVDSDLARRVLRKHNGDMDRAADALLTGDTAEVWDVQVTAPNAWEPQHRTTPDPMFDGKKISTPTSTAIAPHKSSSVIDLSGDDDDMTRAIQMSMQESSQSLPQFGPSERAPHPDWQIVASNAPIASADDHTLNEAIQASLQDFKEDEDDTAAFKEAIREGGRPIALRPETRAFAYAALVIQALYFVPQVRSTVSTLRLPAVPPGTPIDHPDSSMRNLIELFTNMDLAQLAAIIDNELLPSMDVRPFDGRQLLADASSNVVRSVSALIEQHLQAQAGPGEEPEQLFSFIHGNIALVNDRPQKISKHSEAGNVVSVEFGIDPHLNDLVGCMSANLTKYDEQGSYHDVIIKPSEVLAFQLRRITPGTGTGTGVTPPDPFVYPKSIFLDRFLFDNLALANSKRKQERSMLEDIKQLKEVKESLTRTDGRDSLQNLQSTIHYYENVADPGDDPARKRTLKAVAEHLKDVMSMVQNKVEEIDHQVETIHADLAVLFDCPELQMFQYDLRSVLVHTGLPGRKQIYSYVQDTEGVWWKTVDDTVTEVPEETVLTDPTGLHLGAGPYMVFYSRHLSNEQIHEPLVWPSQFSEAVAENNKKFLAMMHPELEIFSNTNLNVRSSPEGMPVTRELPVPPASDKMRISVSRENSQAMMVDSESQSQMSTSE